MQNITENLTSVISQITAIEKENEKLKRINKTLLLSYNTDTHILVEKETLNDLVNEVDIIVSDADSSSSNCERIEDEVSNAKYYAVECSSGAYDVRDKLEEILKPKEEEKQPKEEGITKVVVNVNKSNR
tara:strand:- start:141 stop:527 length:387 start_codon:yes stop_codon:yes gene_type:complete